MARVRSEVLAILIGVAACGGSSSSSDPDAARVIDAAPAVPDSPADVGPEVVYLNFDGVMLKVGADNPVTNTSSLIPAPVMAPAYLAGVADRQTKIDAIVTAVAARFAPYHVQVVTTRPATPLYTMMLVTGPSTSVGLSSSINAVAPFVCTGPANPTISMVFSSAAATDSNNADTIANEIIAMLGIEHQIPPTTVKGDCMCFAAQACGIFTTACTVGGAGTAVDTASACPGAPATQDEQALFLAALGARP